MIRTVDGRIEVMGPINMASAAQLLAAGEAAIVAADAGKSVTFDLAAVTEMDSSCLALVFAWMRVAKSRGIAIRLLNTPQNLLSLAAVYDVADLLPA